MRGIRYLFSHIEINEEEAAIFEVIGDLQPTAYAQVVVDEGVYHWRIKFVKLVLGEDEIDDHYRRVHLYIVSGNVLQKRVLCVIGIDKVIALKMISIYSYPS